MPVATVTESEFELLDTGTYEAKLIAVEDVEGGQFGPSWKWIWRLVDFPNMPERWAFSDAKVTTRNKTGRWLAALGLSIENGDPVDTDELINKKALLDIVIKSDKPETGDYNRIENVRPLRKSARAARTARVDNDDEDEGLT